MILLQVYSESFGIFPFEGDAPRPVYVDRVALRLPMQRMKIKTGLPQVVECSNRVESIESYYRPAL